MHQFYSKFTEGKIIIKKNKVKFAFGGNPQIYDLSACVRASVQALIVSRSISAILFEVGIPKLVCGYTSWSKSVAYYFWATVTLTFGLTSRKTYPEHISYIISGRNSEFSVRMHFGSRIVSYLFRVTVTLTSGLNSRKKSCPERFFYII